MITIHIYDESTQQTRAYSGKDLNGLLQFSERSILEIAMRIAKGNQTKAAQLLNLPRSTFQSKLSKYKITSYSICLVDIPQEGAPT